jgi:nicotinamidase-related amidase
MNGGSAMVALLVIDMQVGLFEGKPPRHDEEGVVQRTNEIAAAVRATDGIVIFIQHEDDGGLTRESKGWEILPTLKRVDTDLMLRKQACDSFYETGLSDLLKQHGVGQIIMTGCATDFCVDTTVRAAASRDFEVVVAADAHTTKDRPHLDAQSIIRHHNWMWANLILPKSEVKVLPTVGVLAWLESVSGYPA